MGDSIPRKSLFYSCTVLSAFGLFSPFGLLSEIAALSNASTSFHSHALIIMLGIIQLYAWAAYFVMGFAWIQNRFVNKLWPITGTAAGIASILLLFPVLSTDSTSTVGLFTVEGFIKSTMISLFLGSIFTGTAIIMAITLVKYHLFSVPQSIAIPTTPIKNELKFILSIPIAIILVLTLITFVFFIYFQTK